MSICECPTCQGINTGPCMNPARDNVTQEPTGYGPVNLEETDSESVDQRSAFVAARMAETIEKANATVTEMMRSRKQNIDHAALAVAHWDHYSGPLIEAAIAAGGHPPDPAMLALLRYVAISHWVHGAKHERENK